MTEVEESRNKRAAGSEDALRRLADHSEIMRELVERTKGRPVTAEALVLAHLHIAMAKALGAADAARRFAVAVESLANSDHYDEIRSADGRPVRYEITALQTLVEGALTVQAGRVQRALADMASA